jgi:hypothetical protein
MFGKRSDVGPLGNPTWRIFCFKKTSFGVPQMAMFG